MDKQRCLILEFYCPSYNRISYLVPPVDEREREREGGKLAGEALERKVEWAR